MHRCHWLGEEMHCNLPPAGDLLCELLSDSLRSTQFANETDCGAVASGLSRDGCTTEDKTLLLHTIYNYSFTDFIHKCV